MHVVTRACRGLKPAPLSLFGSSTQPIAAPVGQRREWPAHSPSQPRPHHPGKYLTVFLMLLLGAGSPACSLSESETWMELHPARGCEDQPRPRLLVAYEAPYFRSVRILWFSVAQKSVIDHVHFTDPSLRSDDTGCPSHTAPQITWLA